jgi:hypothetical protein
MFLEQKLFYKSYDPGAAYVYGRLSQWLIPGKYGIQTSGPGTTLIATNGSPFSPVTVGSRISAYTPPDTFTDRTVTAKASDTSLTIDSVASLAAGTNWGFYHFKSGTTDADGWHNISNLKDVTIYASLEVLGSTSIDLQIQTGGGAFSVPVQATTNPAAVSATVSFNIAAVGVKAIELTSVAQSLRIGVRAVGGPAVDAITIWIEGRQLVTGF